MSRRHCIRIERCKVLGGIAISVRHSGRNPITNLVTLVIIARDIVAIQVILRSSASALSHPVLHPDIQLLIAQEGRESAVIRRKLAVVLEEPVPCRLEIRKIRVRLRVFDLLTGFNHGIGSAGIEIQVAHSGIFEVLLFRVVAHGFIGPRHAHISKRHVVVRSFQHTEVREYLLVVSPGLLIHLTRSECSKALEYRLGIVISLGEVQERSLNHCYPGVLKALCLLDGCCADNGSVQLIEELRCSLLVRLHGGCIVNLQHELLSGRHSVNELILLPDVFAVRIDESVRNFLPIYHDGPFRLVDVVLLVPLPVGLGGRSLSLVRERCSALAYCSGMLAVQLAVAVQLEYFQPSLLRVLIRIGVSGGVNAMPYKAVVLCRCLRERYRTVSTEDIIGLAEGNLLR